MSTVNAIPTPAAVNVVSVSITEQEAENNYQLTIDKRDATALYTLGKLFEAGIPIINVAGESKKEPDYYRAAHLYRIAVDEGSEDAKKALEGIFERFDNAVKHNSENLDAQRMLGWCYQWGIGVKANGEKAIQCFEKAKEGGYLDAIFKLGTCYACGIGVKEDKERAFKLYDEAAKGGHIYACFSLGECYEKGIGVATDIQKAIECYDKADKQGLIQAKRAVEELRKKIASGLAQSSTTKAAAAATAGVNVVVAPATGNTTTAPIVVPPAGNVVTVVPTATVAAAPPVAVSNPLPCVVANATAASIQAVAASAVVVPAISASPMSLGAAPPVMFSGVGTRETNNKQNTEIETLAKKLIVEMDKLLTQYKEKKPGSNIKLDIANFVRKILDDLLNDKPLGADISGEAKNILKEQGFDMPVKGYALEVRYLKSLMDFAKAANAKNQGSRAYWVLGDRGQIIYDNCITILQPINTDISAGATASIPNSKTRS